MNFSEELLLEIKESLRLTGNKFLYTLFDSIDFKKEEDKNLLLKRIKEYNIKLYLNLDFLRKKNEEDEDKKIYFHYIYLNDIIINIKNIDSINLTKEFDRKKQRYIFGIKIMKKFPSLSEDNYVTFFDTEEERNKNLDILRGKLNICFENII